MTLNDVINDIIDAEGGFTDNINDAGGPTKYGVTQETLSAYRKQVVSVDDVRRLSRSEAFTILKYRYVVDPLIDTLPSPLIPAVADFSVNSGASQAVKTLQRLVGAAADGIIGVETQNAVRSALDRESAQRLVIDYTEARLVFLAAVVKRRPDNVAFLGGWVRRVMRFL